MTSHPHAAAYWLVAPHQGEIRDTLLHNIEQDSLVLETLYTGISPGTERLVGQGKVPVECWETMRCGYMEGSFKYPLKYGYNLVGRAKDGAHQGKRFFVMHPHQSQVIVQQSDVYELPDWLSSTRATLIPNLETALNAVWDAQINPDDRVLIVGAGIVGILISYVLGKMFNFQVDILEKDTKRLKYLQQLPWLANSNLENTYHEDTYTAVFHTSASSAGLQSAINALTFEGRCIEVSWYGSQAISVNLGGSFHYQRKQIIASQVSSIAQPIRHRINYHQRKDRVVHLLDDDNIDILLDPVVKFSDLPSFMSLLYQHQIHPVSALVEY